MTKTYDRIVNSHEGTQGLMKTQGRKEEGRNSHCVLDQAVNSRCGPEVPFEMGLKVGFGCPAVMRGCLSDGNDPGGPGDVTKQESRLAEIMGTVKSWCGM